MLLRDALSTLMQGQVSPRSARKRKVPLWLSDCVLNDVSRGNSDREEETSDQDEEDFLLEPAKLPYRPKNVKLANVNDSELSYNALQRVPEIHTELPRQHESPSPKSFPEGHALPALDSAKQHGESIAQPNERSEEFKEQQPEYVMSSYILELPADLLARILGCLPINILLQTSAVGYFRIAIAAANCYVNPPMILGAFNPKM